MNAGPTGIQGALPATTAVSITAAGAGLDIYGSQQTIASLSGVAGANVFLGGGVLTVNNSGNTNYAGNISDAGGAGSGAGGSLVMNGAGMLTLNGVSSYSGSTVVNSGTLCYGAASVASSAAAVVINGGVLDVTGTSQTVYSLTMNGGGLNLSVANPLTANNYSTIGGALNLFGTPPGSGTYDLINFPSGYWGECAAQRGLRQRHAQLPRQRGGIELYRPRRQRLGRRQRQLEQ